MKPKSPAILTLKTDVEHHPRWFPSRPSALFPGITMRIVNALYCSISLLSICLPSFSYGADPSEEFFNDLVMPILDISLSDASIDQLKRNPREYVQATLSDGLTTWQQVAIKLKGAAGSFRQLHQKPGFTLNMDKYTDGQRFQGVDKFYLNNSVQDPSYLNELICSDLYLRAGIPAPRVTLALVRLNDRVLGIYVLKEGFDKAFLKRHFAKHKGNLYDPGNARDIDNPLERDSGEGRSDGSDVIALVNAVNEIDGRRRWQQIQSTLDVDRFITFVALEVITWHWDGYAMNRSNYRIYHDPSKGRIVFMPHGMDQMFWNPEGSISPQFKGLVAQKVLELPQAKQRYRERLESLLTSVFTPERTTNRINAANANLAPLLALLGDQATAEHRKHAEIVGNRILKRYEFLRNEVSGRAVASPR